MPTTVHLLGIVALSLPACSLVFDESSTLESDAGSASTDAAGVDFDDFENGFGNWAVAFSRGSCAREADPMDPTNTVVCCEAQSSPTGYGVIQRPIDGKREVDIAFRMYVHTPPKGDPSNPAFSPMAGLHDSESFSNSVLANVNTFSDSSFNVASIIGAGSDGSAPTIAFPDAQWLDLRFGASSRDACPEVSTTATSEATTSSTTIAITNPFTREFKVASLGVFRQHSDAGTPRRCFDDVQIHYEHVCLQD